MTTPKERKSPGIFFEAMDRFGRPISYPAWRYHAIYEPRIVNNTEQDLQAEKEGWKNPQVPITAVQGFSNFYHDLEDMTPRQLVYYAKSEFGAELPEVAGKQKLLHAIWRLFMVSPKSRNRMVLLAQSIEMNYDETVKEIERLAGDMDMCQEVVTEELWL